MLAINTNIMQQMIDHAMREYPLEACGYLAGVDSRADAIYALTNADASEEHFSFIPSEQFQAVKKARASGRELLAVYHSHPKTPARMSAEDIRLAYDERMQYVIVSLADAEPMVKSFTVRNGLVSEEHVEAV